MPLPLRHSLPLLGLLCLASCKPSAEPAKITTAPAPINVRVAPVALSTASPAIRVAAVLARQTEAELAFPVAGLVDTVSVRAGDRVTRDQELARLQPDQTEAQVTQATSLHDKAKRDLARVEKLQAERVATLENLQDARSAVDQAAAALRIAEFNRRHAIIHAPADGVVLRRLAEPNELVPAGKPILSFASAGDGWIAKAGITARDAARIVVGTGVQLADLPGGNATGKIARIAEAADPATRTVPIEVLLDAPPIGARSGLVVSLTIAPEPVASRVVVPLAALRDGVGGQAALFYLLPGGTMVKRLAVELEQVDGDRAYLRTAVPAEALVVVTGGQYLSDGSTVSVSK